MKTFSYKVAEKYNLLVEDNRDTFSTICCLMFYSHKVSGYVICDRPRNHEGKHSVEGEE